jgi:hypothetical protein
MIEYYKITSDLEKSSIDEIFQNLNFKKVSSNLDILGLLNNINELQNSNNKIIIINKKDSRYDYSIENISNLKILYQLESKSIKIIDSNSLELDYSNTDSELYIYFYNDYEVNVDFALKYINYYNNIKSVKLVKEYVDIIENSISFLYSPDVIDIQYELNEINLIIKNNNVQVTNEDDDIYDISNLYLVYKFVFNLFIHETDENLNTLKLKNIIISGFRDSFDDIYELSYGFLHPHLPTNALNALFKLNNFCLGSSDINVIVFNIKEVFNNLNIDTSNKKEIISDNLDLLFTQCIELLEWESKEGGPYRSINSFNLKQLGKRFEDCYINKYLQSGNYNDYIKSIVIEYLYSNLINTLDLNYTIQFNANLINFTNNNEDIQIISKSITEFTDIKTINLDYEDIDYTDFNYDLLNSYLELSIENAIFLTFKTNKINYEQSRKNILKIFERFNEEYYSEKGSIEISRKISEIIKEYICSKARKNYLPSLYVPRCIIEDMVFM